MSVPADGAHSRDTTQGGLIFGMDYTIGRRLFPMRATDFSAPGSATTNPRNVSEWSSISASASWRFEL